MLKRAGKLWLRTSVLIFLGLFLAIGPVVTAWADDSTYQLLSTPFYDPRAVACDTNSNLDTSGSTVLVGNGNDEKAFNYFVNKGFSAVQAAGIAGNLYWESSGIDPTVNQSGTDPARGIGIAQWSYNDRWQKLLSFASAHKKDPYDLGLQLDYLWFEMTTGYSTVITNIKKTTTLEDAVNQFMGPLAARTGQPAQPISLEVARAGGFENPGSPHFDGRLSAAQTILGNYGGNALPAANNTTACVSTSAVDCSGAAVDDNLGAVRQKVVCLAQAELASWTPLPPTPRLQYLKYSDNAREEWCADFASWLYNQAGDSFSGGSSGGWRMPAVAQIRLMAQQNQNFHWHADHSYVPRPGDLAIYNGDGPDSHVNMVVSVTGSRAILIGGDEGDGPYGGSDNAAVVQKDGPMDFWTSTVAGYVSPD